VSYAFLGPGLLAGGTIRTDLAAPVAEVALAWLEAGIDPAAVEIAAELVARLAAQLGEERAGAEDLVLALEPLGVPAELVALVRAAAPQPLGATEVAALGVLLVDIAERAALELFVPELPALTAKSDRSGDAARRVGAARHLRG
jgi:hypothetical protein